MLKGFRDFLLRGNVLDLAVAVIIGAAFTAIVTSLVANIINPLIAALVGKPDFSAMVLPVGSGIIKYGAFLNSVIDFILLAAVIYFVLVIPGNYLMARMKKPVEVVINTKTCAQCLSEIPLAAARCKFCTQPA